MKRPVSQWNPNECVLIKWVEVLGAEKMVIRHQKSMLLGKAVEFVVTVLEPKWQKTAKISGHGETWHIDMIKAAFERMRGSAMEK